jgi:hypothetical protein
MEGDDKQQQSIVEKEKTFVRRLLDIMAHFIAIFLVLFIMWHAVPGSSKMHRFLLARYDFIDRNGLLTVGGICIYLIE